MIYTITLNPSVDVYTDLEELKFGRINRSRSDHKSAGGKAIVVSRLLNSMGIPSLATGFLGGFSGDYIRSYLNEEGIQNDFVEVKGDTRINVRMTVDGKETRINGVGPNVSMLELNELMYYISRVREGDFVIVGGSIPVNIPSTVYERIIEICVVNGASFIPDIPVEQLYRTLAKKPLLIKPTVVELSDMFGVKLETVEEIVPYGIKCLEMGAQNVIVSRGREGALLFTSDKKVYEYKGVEGAMVNAIAFNDAILAGFIGTYVHSSDPVASFKAAGAASNAALFTDEIPSKEEIEEMYEYINVEQIA